MHHLLRAYENENGKKYIISPHYEMQIRRRLGRRRLKKAMQLARYHKIGGLDLAIQPAFRLGYQPKIILNYRMPEPILMSTVPGRTYSSAEDIHSEYMRTYRQGFALLYCFGGCLIDYDDLMDKNNTD
ncbi:MAG: hypothetical protein O7D86_11480 [Proteobacteria bacterium]|nr:hypothetical protein [Pseudomonadota bacterium]